MLEIIHAMAVIVGREASNYSGNCVNMCVYVCVSSQYWTAAGTGRLPRGRRPLEGTHSMSQFLLQLHCLKTITDQSNQMTKSPLSPRKTMIYDVIWHYINKLNCSLHICSVHLSLHPPFLSLSPGISVPHSLTSSNPLSRVNVDGGPHQIAVSLSLFPQKVHGSPRMGLHVWGKKKRYKIKF